MVREPTTGASHKAFAEWAYACIGRELLEDFKADLLAIEDEARADAESKVRALRDVLWGTRVRELNSDGSPCWCDHGFYPDDGIHQSQCGEARQALADNVSEVQP